MSDKKLPKISIVTPSYNQGQYLEKTILSIIGQEYTNYELIIIDGGSTDNSLDVIKKYEQNIKYWISEPDQGQADAINKGLTHASGDIFNWINSDDFLEPGSLKTIGQFFFNNKDKNVLCGYTRCFYDEDDSTSHTYQMGVRKSSTHTILNTEMNQPGTFYRMDIIRALGGVNTSLRYIFDNELWYRYLLKFGLKAVGFTDELLSQFRLHKNSKTVADGFKRFKEEENNVLKFLASAIHMDAAVMEQINSMPSTNYYQTASWDLTYLDKKVLSDAFAEKSLVSLIQNGFYQEARKGLRYRINEKRFSLNRLNLSAFFKLFVWPGYLK